MNLVYGVSCLVCLGNHKDTAVCRFLELFLDVLHVHFLVGNEAVGSAANHSKAFLDYLLKAAADGHHFSHAFHAAADMAAHSVEFRKVPARNLAHYIVQGRLKEGRSGLGHGVFQLEQPVSQTELGGHESQRISGGLGGQG